jgi:hypothetical protein
MSAAAGPTLATRQKKNSPAKICRRSPKKPLIVSRIIPVDLLC